MNFRLDFLKKQMLNLKQNLLVLGLHFLGSSDCNFLLSISFDVFTEYSILCLPQLLMSALLKISRMLKKFLNFFIFFLGMEHLRSPLHEVPWYKMLLLDVFAFFAAAASILGFLLYSIAKFLLRKCFRTQKSKTD
jgi:hypothetical protein